MRTGRYSKFCAPLDPEELRIVGDIPQALPKPREPKAGATGARGGFFKATPSVSGNKEMDPFEAISGRVDPEPSEEYPRSGRRATADRGDPMRADRTTTLFPLTRSEYVKKVGDGLGPRILRAIGFEKAQECLEYSASFVEAKAAKSSRSRPVQLFFHKLSAWVFTCMIVVGLTWVGCKPASEAEYPYGVSPPNQTIVASGPLPTVPKHTSDVRASSSGKVSTSDEQMPKREEELPTSAPDSGEERSNAGTSQETARSHVQIELNPTSIVGRSWVGTHLSAKHTWELRNNGFFEFRKTSSDGELVQRMGTYQIQKGELLVQYREIRSHGGENQPATTAQTSTGSETFPISGWSDGRIRLGDVWLSPQ